MPEAFLTRSRLVQQPFLWVISVCCCGLSLFFTLSFCRHLWAQESSLVVAAFGLAWELAKLQFGPRAFLKAGEGRESRAMQWALLALTAVLMAGSIMASFGHLAQTHDRQLAASRAQHTTEALQAAQASDAHQAARRALTSLDTEIDALTAAVADDMAHHFRTRAVAAATALTALRDRRDKLVADMAHVQRVSQEAADPTDFFEGLGAMWPGDARANANRIKVAAHLVLAVMLELVGIAAWSIIAQAGRHPTAGVMQLTTGTPDDEGRGSKKRLGPDRDRTPSRHTAVRPVSHLALYRTPRSTRRCAPGRQPHPPTSRSAPQYEPQSADARCSACTPEKYEQAKALVTSRMLAPSHRGLRLRLRIGQQTARAFLQRLCLEGYIKKTGNRYKLTPFGAPIAA